jgi:glycosyltransferase involved in cell wall biosynthesis
MTSPNVVLAHDWLNGMRGGERVLEELCRLFPDAPIYTLLHERGSVSPTIEARRIVTSPLQRLPASVRRGYRQLLPLMPAAVRALRLPPCDLVLSSSHCAIKAVRPPRGSRHLCYIHTPMRYIWEQQSAYFDRGRTGLPTRIAAGLGSPLLRAWDRRTASRVDRFVANSQVVQARVRRAYGRESGRVPPPVDLARFTATPSPGARGFYLMVTAFAPYKRVELALEAFRRLGRPLRVVGAGQDLDRLRPLFGGRVEYLGSLPDADVTRLYAECRAFVMPGEEDFGITPLEAQASGRPVIALDRGGATETVVPLDRPNATGVLFPGGAIEDLVTAVRTFEAAETRFSPEACRRQAERFSAEAFRRGILAEVEGILAAAPARV